MSVRPLALTSFTISSKNTSSCDVIALMRSGITRLAPNYYIGLKVSSNSVIASQSTYPTPTVCLFNLPSLCILVLRLVVQRLVACFHKSAPPTDIIILPRPFLNSGLAVLHMIAPVQKLGHEIINSYLAVLSAMD